MNNFNIWQAEVDVKLHKTNNNKQRLNWSNYTVHFNMIFTVIISDRVMINKTTL